MSEGHGLDTVRHTLRAREDRHVVEAAHVVEHRGVLADGTLRVSEANLLGFEPIVELHHVGVVGFRRRHIRTPVRKREPTVTLSL